MDNALKAINKNATTTTTTAAAATTCRERGDLIRGMSLYFLRLSFRSEGLDFGFGEFLLGLGLHRRILTWRSSEKVSTEKKEEGERTETAKAALTPLHLTRISNPKGIATSSPGLRGT